MGLLFVVDEDMGSSIATTLSRMNHEVVLATEVLQPGAPDLEICMYAEEIGAIIVTRNKKDYFRLLARGHGGGHGDFERAGCIVVSCDHGLGRARLRTFRTLWELEAKLVASHSDPRVMLEILPDSVVIFR